MAEVTLRHCIWLGSPRQEMGYEGEVQQWASLFYMRGIGLDE